MIRIDGQLVIRTIPGRYGAFNVARLITSIGEFAVKDALLEQYTEGKYDGTFVIAHISPSSYTTGGRTVIEVRARLDSMSLNEMDTLSQDDTDKLEAREPDPLEEERDGSPAKPVIPPAPVDETPFGMSQAELKPVHTELNQPASTTEETGDAQLFGTVWPLGDTVKLDTTVDRQRLRDQSKRLGELGYILDFKSQIWLRQN